MPPKKRKKQAALATPTICFFGDTGQPRVSVKGVMMGPDVWYMKMVTSSDLNARATRVRTEQGNFLVTASKDYSYLSVEQVTSLVASQEIDQAVHTARGRLSAAVPPVEGKINGVLLYDVEEGASMANFRVLLGGKDMEVTCGLPGLEVLDILASNATAKKTVKFAEIEFPAGKMQTDWATHKEFQLFTEGVDWAPHSEARYLFR